MLRHQLEILQLPATPDTLLLQDLSIYRDFAEYPRLSLLKPGSKHPIELRFSPSTVNVYTKRAAGALTDGVYAATYSVAPHDQAKVCYYFLRTENLVCQLQIWMNTIDWVNEPTDSKNYSLLTRFSGLLLAAQSSVPNNPKKANEYYSLAKKLLTHDHCHA